MSEKMNRPSAYEIFHWKMFNSVSRLVGWGFLSVGSIGAIFGFIVMINPNATMDVQGIPTTDVGLKSIGFLAPLVFAVLGFFLLKAKPYYSPRVREWMRQADDQQEERQT